MRETPILPCLPQPADQLPSAQPSPDPAMFMRAQVLNRQGEPFVEAEVDIWHSSSVRLYENRDPTQESMNQRVKFTTDDDGRFWFQLVKPTGYPILTHGVVGKLLAVQSRHPFRPAHVHALIFKADPYPHFTWSVKMLIRNIDF